VISENTATVAHSITETGISIKEFGAVAALIICAIAVLTYFKNKRREDQDDAARRTAMIMDEIKKSQSTSEKDVRLLSEKVVEGKTILEKEIERIGSVTRHDIKNLDTKIASVNHFNDKNTDEITKLRDRMTAQETNSKHQNDALNKLEVTVREKIDEMKDLIKLQGETSTTQFRELAASIREARDVKIKAI
jgi:hypothetical protein